MPRIKRRTIYQVINDFGEVYQEFSDEEKAEDYLTELLEGLRQIEENERMASNSNNTVTQKPIP